MLVVDNVDETVIGIDLLRRVQEQSDLRGSNVKITNQDWKVLVDGNIMKTSITAVTVKDLQDCTLLSVKQCVQEFLDLFASSGGDFGLCTRLEHTTTELQLGSCCKPVQRRVPQKLLLEFRRQIAEVLEKGDNTEEPVLLARKTDGSSDFVWTFVN